MLILVINSCILECDSRCYDQETSEAAFTPGTSVRNTAAVGWTLAHKVSRIMSPLTIALPCWASSTASPCSTGTSPVSSTALAYTHQISKHTYRNIGAVFNVSIAWSTIVQQRVEAEATKRKHAKEKPLAHLDLVVASQVFSLLSRPYTAWISHHSYLSHAPCEAQFFSGRHSRRKRRNTDRRHLCCHQPRHYL